MSKHVRKRSVCPNMYENESVCSNMYENESVCCTKTKVYVQTCLRLFAVLFFCFS